MENYGSTKEEIDAEKMLQCRQIVKEIVNFEVSDAQKVQIIKLLACELENINLMKDIVNIIKSRTEEAEKQKIIVT